jgi:fibro-slime domain-containing protein
MKIKAAVYALVFAAAAGGGVIACSSNNKSGSTVPTGSGGAPGTAAGAATGAGSGNIGLGTAGAGLLILPPDDASTADSGTGGNAAAQCNGKFTGYLRDFAVGKDPDGLPLDPTATPPIAVAIGGVNYASSPDFEVADARLHPATAAGKRFTADPGMVDTMLGADQTPVYAGPAAGTITTTGPANFQTWFHDTAGVNLGQNLTLQFEADPTKASDPNAYYFDSSTMGCGSTTCPGFFPIDGKLLLNEGNPHNYHMTFELHLQFKYHAGQLFTFKGDDDIWVFIDNKLGLDLGGIHNEVTGQVMLDSLGLVDGQVYPLDFFWCERHVVGSNLRIETSLEVTGCGTPVVPK